MRSFLPSPLQSRPMTETVSVAMATYNGAEFIRDQLRSLALQKRLPDELVVSDDGSTDDTVDILEAFAETAPFPVRISVNRENLGFTRNFERAILGCGGDIIYICDQDDVWFPNKIQS